MTPPTASMPVRRCGSSELQLPVLGIGCWAYGGGGYWGAQSQQDVDAVVRRAVARHLGLSTAELALKWACAREDVTSSLCGSRNVAALEVNVRAAAEPLDPAVVAELNRLTEPLLAALGPSFDYYEHPANDRTK